jgi:adenosylcobinamide-GDP ribazoletransferase
MPDRSGVRAQVRAFAAAIAFLTRLPAFAEHDASDLPAAAMYFPAVGLIVGGIGAIAFWFAANVWPPTLAIIVSVGLTVFITGAFHEDALADALDGFGGGWDKAQVLAIMKDSRIGSYALVGVLLVLAAKIAALRTIFDAVPTDRHTLAGGGVAVGRALIAAHVLGRWSSVALIAGHDYVRAPATNERATGRPFVGAVTRTRLVAATIGALAITTIALGRWAVAVVIVAAIATWLAGRYFERRIGGITGDALGAANQAVELAVYLTLAAHW